MPADLVLASRVQRLVTLLFDGVVQIVIATLVGFTLGRLGAERDVKSTVFAVVVIYYVAFEATRGRTPGKMITGTRVVTESGARASLGQILVRTVLRFLPFEQLSFLGKEQYGWHDSLSRTRVISDRG